MKQFFERGDVVTFKFINGEEVIAKIVSHTTSGIVVTKALTISMTPQGFALTPFVLTVEESEEYMIQENSIMLFAETEKSIKNFYIEKTTGITIVK